MCRWDRAAYQGDPALDKGRPLKRKRLVNTTTLRPWPAQDPDCTAAGHTVSALNHCRRTHGGSARTVPSHCLHRRTPNNPGAGTSQPPSPHTPSKSSHHGLHRHSSAQPCQTASPPAPHPQMHSHLASHTKPHLTLAQVPHNPEPGATQRLAPPVLKAFKLYVVTLSNNLMCSRIRPISLNSIHQPPHYSTYRGRTTETLVLPSDVHCCTIEPEILGLYKRVVKGAA
jgi:hypothetical protein